MAARACHAPREAGVYLCAVFLLQRGKTVPEELVKPEELSKYRQVASHVVSAVMRAGARTLPPRSWARGPLLCRFAASTSNRSAGQSKERVATLCRSQQGPPRDRGGSCCWNETPWVAPRVLSVPFGGIFLLAALIGHLPSRRGCTAPASQGSLPWTSVLPTPTRSSPVREPPPLAGDCVVSAKSLWLPGSRSLSLCFGGMEVGQGA